MFEAELIEYLKARQTFQGKFEMWASASSTLEDIAGVFNKLTPEEHDMPPGLEYEAVRKRIVFENDEARPLWEENERFWKETVAPLQVLRDKAADALSDKAGKELGQESAGPYFLSRVSLCISMSESYRRYLLLEELEAGDFITNKAAQSLVKKLSELALPQAAAIAEQMKKEK